MKYTEELSLIRDLVRQAYDRFGCRRPTDIQQKSEFDLVTDIDYKIEKFLIDSIKAKYPLDNFHSEEFNSTGKISGRSWIIDPIDGTCNFSNGIPAYGIQCALAIDKVIELSYIYLPLQNEEFHAIRCHGAFMNGSPMHANSSCLTNNAIISIGDYPHKDPDNSKRQLDAVGKIYDKIAKIRMFGAACIDFSYAASGRTNGCVLITKNAWDISPGILLCEEAGCIVTDLEGNGHTLDSEGVIIASTPQIHTLLTAAFSKK